MVLVTGGLGYIGSHTVVELIKNNKDVIILDNLSNSNKIVLDNIFKITGVAPKFYKADILDDIRYIFKENDIDSVIHFAALKAVNESISKPLEYYENNVSGTINLLKIMKEFSVEKFIFSSSATVYGSENKIPFKENMQLSAINPYGQTKLIVENILNDIQKTNEIFKTAILRYFNPIGAHESGLIGEEPNGIPNNLLPYIMQVIEGKREKLMVYGDDYETCDGTGVRDYIHVVDIAKGHVMALDYLFSKNASILVNLGTGKGASVLEVLKTCETVINKKIPYEIAPRREGDVPICYADTNLAYEMLGFKAEKTLFEMCTDSINYVKNKKI